MPHRYTQTPEQAVADALNAGVSHPLPIFQVHRVAKANMDWTDVDCGTYYPIHLLAAYSQRLFNESILTYALTRQYGSLVKLGHFDPPSATPYRSLGWADVSTPQAEQLAYRTAVEGITLLKNDGALSLSVGLGMSIASIGNWANATTQMQGNHYGAAPYLISPLAAAEELGVKVSYGTGPAQGNPTIIGWDDSLAATKNSGIVIYTGGIDNSVESEGIDRNLISWSGGQIDLITDVCSVGKKCILLQMVAAN